MRYQCPYLAPCNKIDIDQSLARSEKAFALSLESMYNNTTVSAESSQQQLPMLPAAFTACSSAFTALEFMEAVSYDVVIIEKDMEHLSAGTRT